MLAVHSNPCIDYVCVAVACVDLIKWLCDIMRHSYKQSDTQNILNLHMQREQQCVCVCVCVYMCVCMCSLLWTHKTCGMILLKLTLKPSSEGDSFDVLLLTITVSRPNILYA